jgi:hypothetical protein
VCQVRKLILGGEPGVRPDGGGNRKGREILTQPRTLRVVQLTALQPNAHRFHAPPKPTPPRPRQCESIWQLL